MDAIYIKKGFIDFINEKTKNPKHAQQRAFLLNHERRHIAEENVLKELKSASLRFGARWGKKQVDDLIRAGATIFCDCAIQAKIKELMTDAELRRQEELDEEYRMRKAQDMVDQMEKEALSTAVTKSMAVPNASKANGNPPDRLGDGGGDGTEVRPSPGSSACNGSESAGV